MPNASKYWFHCCDTYHSSFIIHHHESFANHLPIILPAFCCCFQFFFCSSYFLFLVVSCSLLLLPRSSTTPLASIPRPWWYPQQMWSKKNMKNQIWTRWAREPKSNTFFLQSVWLKLTAEYGWQQRKQPLQPHFLEYFSPQRSMFETNPETCFVHDLCPPTTTPISPRIISICNPFNLNFLNISAHNEACLRLTLKHASHTTSVHPQLPPFSPRGSMFETNPEACFVHDLCPPTTIPPFPPGSSPSASHLISISWIFQPTTKHVWD